MNYFLGRMRFSLHIFSSFLFCPYLPGVLLIGIRNTHFHHYISMRRNTKNSLILFGVVGTVVVTMALVLPFLFPDSQPASQVTITNSEGIIGVWLFGLFLGVLFFLNGLISMKKKQFMQTLQTSKIRSLAIGLAEIYGKVAPCNSGIMKSPFSNRDCVGAKIIIEKHSGDPSGPDVIKELVLGIEFFLQDDTSMVLVDLRGAKLDIPVSYEFDAMEVDPPPTIVTFLKKHNIAFNPRLYFLESIIKPGDELYILGRADYNPNFRDGDSEHGVQNLMMQQSHNPDIYFISTRSKKQILKKMKYTIIAAIFGGLLLIGGSLLLIAFYFELILSSLI